MAMAALDKAVAASRPSFSRGLDKSISSTALPHRSKRRLSPSASTTNATTATATATPAFITTTSSGSSTERHRTNVQHADAGANAQSVSISNPTGPAVTGSDWELMQDIRNRCHSCEDVSQIFAANRERFSAQLSAAALYQLANLWKTQQQAVPQHSHHFSRASALHRGLQEKQQMAASLLLTLCTDMAAAQLRDLADAWYAVDVLRMHQHASPDAGAPALPNSSSSMYSSGAQAVTVFTTSSLQHSMQLFRRDKVQLRHLSRVLTSLAHTHVHPSLDWWSAALDAAAAALEDLAVQCLQQQQEQQQQQPYLQQQRSSQSHAHHQHHQLQPSVQSLLAREQPHGDVACTNSSSSSNHVPWRAYAQAVALLGWTAAALKAPASQVWWRLYLDTSRLLMPAMSANQLSLCVYTAARAQQTVSPGWSSSLYNACTCCWPEFTSQGFTNLAWGLAVLQQQPKSQWAAQYDAASTTRLPTYTLQHLGLSLWAFARLWQQQQQQLPQSLAQQSQTTAAAAAAAAVPSTAVPKRLPQQRPQQPLLPSAAWQDQAWAQLSRLELNAEAPQAVACLLWGIVRLQLQVPQPRLLELELLCTELVPHMQPHALAVVVWGLGSLRGSSTSRTFIKRLHSCCREDSGLLQQLDPQGLCMLLQGLSNMDAWHPDSFKQGLLTAVSQHIPLLEQQQQGKRPRQQQQQAQVDMQLQGVQPSRSRLTAAALPGVLLCLRQLRIAVPSDVLCRVEATLQTNLDTLDRSQLCLAVFALGATRHNPDGLFVNAVLARMDTDMILCCNGLDVAHILYGLAVISSWGGAGRKALKEPHVQQALYRMVLRAEQVVHEMDSRTLAMLMWAVGRLQLQPPGSLLQTVMSATLQLMPSMSLLSVVTILSAFRALQYLPPLTWMLEACSAARRKVSTETSAKTWQQRDCVRRFEETVAWYNQTMQQQNPGQAPSNGVMGMQVQEDAEVRADMQHQLRVRMAKLAGSNPGSEAMLAAALGAAAAVAQQWHP